MHASAHGMERRSIGTSHSCLGIVGFRSLVVARTMEDKVMFSATLLVDLNFVAFPPQRVTMKKISFIGFPWILELPSTYRVTAPLLATRYFATVTGEALTLIRAVHPSMSVAPHIPLRAMGSLGMLL